MTAHFSYTHPFPPHHETAASHLIQRKTHSVIGALMAVEILARCVLFVGDDTQETLHWPTISVFCLVRGRDRPGRRFRLSRTTECIISDAWRGADCDLGPGLTRRRCVSIGLSERVHSPVRNRRHPTFGRHGGCNDCQRSRAGSRFSHRGLWHRHQGNRRDW